MDKKTWMILAVVIVVLIWAWLSKKKPVGENVTGTPLKLSDTPMFAWMHTIIPKQRTTYLNRSSGVGLPPVHWHSQP